MTEKKPYSIKSPSETSNISPRPNISPIDSSTPVRDTPEEPTKDIQPHGVEYFDVIGWGEILLNDQLDVNEIKPKILYIESFIGNQIAENGLKPDKETYNSLFQEIEKSLGMTKFHEHHNRIDRVYKFLKILHAGQTAKTKLKKFIVKANEEAKKREAMNKNAQAQ